MDQWFYDLSWANSDPDGRRLSSIHFFLISLDCVEDQTVHKINNNIWNELSWILSLGSGSKLVSCVVLNQEGEKRLNQRPEKQ